MWYQKFEYALGHWMQKSTEHVLGSVLCSPGCFSLFRARALMTDNVMKTYTKEAKKPQHFIQYDQGTFIICNIHLYSVILHAIKTNDSQTFAVSN